MQMTSRSTIIAGATALVAVFSAAHAAEPYYDGAKSLRSYLNENLNDSSRANDNSRYGGQTTSVRSLLQGFLKEVGVRRAKKK